MWPCPICLRKADINIATATGHGTFQAIVGIAVTTLRSQVASTAPFIANNKINLKNYQKRGTTGLKFVVFEPLLVLLLNLSAR